MAFKLEPKQLTAVKSCINRKHVLIVLPPGQGKTAIALGLIKVHLASKRMTTALILTHHRGVEAYRKLTGDMALTYIETMEDLRSLSSQLDHNADGVFVVNTGLFPRWPEEWEDVVKLTKSAKDDPKYDLAGHRFIDSVLYRLAGISGLIAIDETHNYRTVKSATSQVLSRLLLDFEGYRVGITATPLYRTLEDMYTVADIISPGILGSFLDFQDEYCVVTERQTQAYKWVSGPSGKRKILFPTTFKDVTGYKNQEAFWEKLAPVLYVDQATDFDIDWQLHPYDLLDWKEYHRTVAGLGLTQGTRISYAGEKGVANRVFVKGETIVVVPREGKPFLKEACDVVKGDDLRVRPNSDEVYQVVKVAKANTEADILARLLPLSKLLSQRPEKVMMLYGVLDVVPADRGAVIFARLHETVDFLEERLSARYPSRNISSIRGGESDMAGRLASCGPSDFILITQVAFQSLDFYYDTIVAYDVVQIPGQMEQLVGRITRMNSSFRSVTAHFIVGRATIEHYYHSRLLFLLRDSPISTVRVPELPFPGVSVYSKRTSLRMLKDALLWKKGVPPSDDEGPIPDRAPVLSVKGFIF